MTVFAEIAEALIEGNAPQVKHLAEKALEQGSSPIDIVNLGLIKGMDVVGEKFKELEISVPEVLISARAMHTGLEIVKPLLSKREVESRAVFMIGTVKGDIHEIGKNLVSMLMEGAGFTIIDLGVDVPAKKFVEEIKEKNPDIVGMSALLTITMQEMEDIIKSIEKAGLRENVKIIIGGAPVTQEFADRIGADGYGEDGRDAVKKAKALLGME
jgi:5-methyltetrahydrofolate--homocysteine methyltransferase